MNKFFKYPGSKNNFLNIILPKINKEKKFYEPFLGSGSVALNLENKDIFATEINDKVFLIWNTFKDIKYKTFKNFYENIIQEFGEIGKNKESYYNARNKLNKRYFQTFSKEEGMFYLIIQQSCMNGIMRYGPKGFNQSFGNRGRSIPFDEKSFSNLQKSIQKIKLKNESYLNYKNLFLNPEYTIFCDPPYVKTNHKYFIDFNRKELIELLINAKAEILYTDIYNEEIFKKISKFKNIEIFHLRKMKSVRPNKKRYIPKNEVLYKISL